MCRGRRDNVAWQGAGVSWSWSIKVVDGIGNRVPGKWKWKRGLK